MKIPVFVSCPSTLNASQELQRKVIINLLGELQLEPRALGRSDYPMDFPLKEVYMIARHCSGGIILGFEQIYIHKAIKKRKTKHESEISDANPISLPTPWNHLEAGILFGMKLPLLVFKEKNIEGGVFDQGVTDAFINPMPEPHPDKIKVEELKHIFLKWYGLVSKHYSEY